MGTVSHANNLMTEACAPKVFISRQDEAGSNSQPTYSESVADERLQVVQIRHRCGGKISTAIIELNLEDWNTWEDGKPTVTRPENYSKIAKVDDLIEVAIPLSYQNKTQYYTLFMGILANPSVKIKGSSVSVSFTAFGVEQRLDDYYVAGRTCLRNPVVVSNTPLLGDIGGHENWSGSDTVGIDLPLIFNEGGLPNRDFTVARITKPNDDPDAEAEGDSPFAEPEPITCAEVYVFSSGATRDTGQDRLVSGAEYWSLSQAIAYIIWCYSYASASGYVTLPTPGELDGVFGDREIGEVNLSGCHTVTECLLTLLRGTPFSFAVTTTSMPARLYFWDRHTGPLTCLQMPDPDNDTVLTAFGANTTEFSMVKRTDQAYNTVTVQGDYKYHQGEFQWRSAYPSDWDFITAWKHSDANIADYMETNESLGTVVITAKQAEFAERFIQGGANYLQYADCFRTFALNETGEYTPIRGELSLSDWYYTPVYNQAVVMNSPHVHKYDFSALFGHNHYMARRRTFLQTIEPIDGDVNNAHYPPMLFISCDNGVTEEQVTKVEWSKDECKFTITTPDLQKLFSNDDNTVNYIQAFFLQTLRIRVVACIQDDQAVKATSPASGATVTRFHKTGYRQDKSIKFQDAFPVQRVNTGGDVTEVDHSSLAMAVATSAQRMRQGGLLECNPVLLGINLQYRPGMRITKVNGRNIDLGTPGVNGTVYPQVIGVKYVFGRGTKPQHSTTLELDVSRG